mgnify:CR=1 FL=1
MDWANDSLNKLEETREGRLSSNPPDIGEDEAQKLLYQYHPDYIGRQRNVRLGPNAGNGKVPYELADLLESDSQLPVGFEPSVNIEKDVLMNPYTPPLKDDSYMPGNSGDPRGIPINISTQGASRNTPYRQVGILTRTNGPETILSLMGRPLFSNRNKWQYYTMNDKGNNIKLPVTNKSKSCTNEYGCDELYNGDSVYVEGINDAFKVTMYDNNVMRYILFL